MRPGQRFVDLRSIDYQAALMLHLVREQLVGQRMALLQRTPKVDRGERGDGSRTASSIRRAKTATQAGRS